MIELVIKSGKSREALASADNFTLWFLVVVIYTKYRIVVVNAVLVIELVVKRGNSMEALALSLCGVESSHGRVNLHCTMHTAARYVHTGSYPTPFQ